MPAKVTKHPSGAFAVVNVEGTEIVVVPKRQRAHILDPLDNLTTEQLLNLDEAIHIAIDILNDKPPA